MSRETSEAAFRAFVAETEPKLRRALVAVYGTARGREATYDALAYAWEHWQKLSAMRNPVGYLYRVGQSSMRTRKRALAVDRPVEQLPAVEPVLRNALAGLPERQRAAVVLVHANGLTVREAAEVLGVSASTVQRHVDRAMVALRLALGEGSSHE